MTLGVTRGALLALLVLAAACGGGDDAAPATTSREPTSTTTTSTTAPERPASTTTTAFDPSSVEGEVEAAYLRSWDVYADAVYNLHLDDQALASVYGGDHLETVKQEIERRIRQREAALVRVDHKYSIQLKDGLAYLIDRYRNHQVLIDPRTKEPVEPDPDEDVADLVTLKNEGQGWRVIRVQEIQ